LEFYLTLCKEKDTKKWYETGTALLARETQYNDSEKGMQTWREMAKLYTNYEVKKWCRLWTSKIWPMLMA